MKTLLTITLFLLVTLMSHAQHFTPVWEGNGYSHMNIYVVNGSIDGQPLQLGDEIAVFSGTKCVGAAVVNNTAMVSIITSANDGTGNGFSTADSITFKIWDKSEAKEVELINVTYNTTFEWWSTGTFEAHGSAFAAIDALNIHKKKVLLKSGINTFSTSLNLLSNSLSEIFNSLISEQKLIKIQDSKGHAFEKVDKDNWINAIGDFDLNQQYVVIVNSDCDLELKFTIKN